MNIMAEAQRPFQAVMAVVAGIYPPSPQVLLSRSQLR